MMKNDKSSTEWLSALADGELQDGELERGIDALRNDPQLQASWKAYHLIRDSVSSNLNDEVDLGLHQRISSAINNEPTVLAPQRRQQRPWVKQVAGVAIAASVTGIAVIGIQQMSGVDSVAAVQPVAQQQEYIRMKPTLVAQKKEASQKNESLDRYLVNHNEYSANSGIQGVLPYVRIVGHKAGQ